MIRSSILILGFPLVLFPSIFHSRAVLNSEFPRSIWPIQFLWLTRIAFISDRCSSTISRTCILVLWSLQLIFSIFLPIHISNASNLLMLSSLSVHVSAAYKATLHTRTFTILFLSPFGSFPLSSSPLLLKASFAIAILFRISFEHLPSSVIVLPRTIDRFSSNYLYNKIALVISLVMKLKLRLYVWNPSWQAKAEGASIKDGIFHSPARRLKEAPEDSERFYLRSRVAVHLTHFVNGHTAFGRTVYMCTETVAETFQNTPERSRTAWR